MLALAGSALLAFGAIFIVPPAYEKYLRDRARSKVFSRVMAMHTMRAPLPTVPSLDRMRADARARSKAAASLVSPPDAGLAAVAPKHRRAD